MTLPDWPPQDWRAWAALISSILGGAALTVLVAWIIWIVAYGDWLDSTQEQRIDTLAKIGFLLLIGIIAIMLAQGMAINRRKISVTRNGIEIEGGGGPAARAIDRANEAAGNLNENGKGDDG